MPSHSASAVPEARRAPNRVRELRDLLGLTQREIAARAGLSLLTVQRVERGYPANILTCRAIQRALGAQRFELVFPEEEPENGDGMIRPASSSSKPEVASEAA